jgi:hypothetical protein
LGFTFDKVETIDRLEAEKILGAQNKREAAREASKEDFNAGQHARISFKTREDRKLYQLLKFLFISCQSGSQHYFRQNPQAGKQKASHDVAQATWRL